ncbi:MAG: tellurite resistance protein TerC [Gemmatimonadales bacterium]|nr:tellurite resistance protein TerC [Gemmatimonadales bacterium]
MGSHPPVVWLGFTGLVLALLVLDLGVLNRRSHVLTLKEALSWSGGVVLLALGFGLFILWREGTQQALEYYTGYLIELSLSVDNLFVFLLIFTYFCVRADAQPKVLKWGILGAIVMRLIMIGLGAFLLHRFSWIVYVFGALLVVTGIRMLTQKEERVDLERNPVVRLARRLIPLSPSYDGTRFFTRTATGKVVATPLLLVVLVVEWSDLVFAIDSIPAIFAVTRDPFLVYSSNVFAILGLRALYFVLAGMLDKFVYLKPGISFILIFVGLKMLLSGWFHFPILLSLGVIVTTLALAVVLSLRQSAREAGAGT